jgi:DNA replication protein DnaC
MSDDYACPFSVCDGSGFVIDEVTRVATPCRCRPARVERRRARLLSAVVPPKYRGVSFDRPPVTEMPTPQVRVVRRFVRDLDDNLRQGRGLWLYGGVGTGKTTLAMLVSRTALDAGHTVAIYSVPKLLSEIRGTYDSGDYLAFFARLEAVDLLHLDDVGSERRTPWVLEQLYSLINARYEAERSVLVTTNLVARAPDDNETRPSRRRSGRTPEEDQEDEQLRESSLQDQIGERTVSRLEEMCTVVPLLGKSERGFAAEDARNYVA